MSYKERSSDFDEVKSYLAAAERVSQLLNDSKVPEEWYSLPRKLVLRKQVLNEVRRQIELLEDALENRDPPADAFADFRTAIGFVVVHSLTHLSEDLHDLFGTLERSIRRNAQRVIKKLAAKTFSHGIHVKFAKKV